MYRETFYIDCRLFILAFCLFFCLLKFVKDDNLFSQPDPEEEDSPFGRKGLFSTTGGGLFDNDDDGDVRNSSLFYLSIIFLKDEEF